MDFSKELLFFFSLLGVFNGLIVAVYFLFLEKENATASKFLGALLLVLSIRIGKSVLLYFHRNLILEIVEIGVIACMFIGPLLYLYIRSNSVEEKRIRMKHLVHLIPIVAIIIYFLAAKQGDYKTDRMLISNIVTVIYFQWFCYLVASTVALKRTLWKTTKKSQKFTKDQIWSVSILLGVFLIWLSYVTFRFTSYIAGAVVFSFTFYILVLVLYDRKAKRKQQKRVPGYRDDQHNEINRQLKQLVEVEKIFTSKDLKMPEMARALKLTPHQFSEYLNIDLNKNFATFINEYRIIEAKQLLKNDANYTMEHIGELSGFKSTSAFYAAFKKQTGVTPSNFRNKD